MAGLLALVLLGQGCAYLRPPNSVKNPPRDNPLQVAGVMQVSDESASIFGIFASFFGLAAGSALSGTTPGVNLDGAFEEIGRLVSER
jgi:hypothetical protein